MLLNYMILIIKCLLNVKKDICEPACEMQNGSMRHYLSSMTHDSLWIRLYVKMDEETEPQKWSQITWIAPSGLDCSIGYKPCLLHVSRLDMDQSKKSENTSNYVIKVVCINLWCLNQVFFCSVNLVLIIYINILHRLFPNEAKSERWQAQNKIYFGTHRSERRRFIHLYIQYSRIQILLKKEKGHFWYHFITPLSGFNICPVPLHWNTEVQAVSDSSPLVYYVANWWHERDGYNIKRQEAKVGGTEGGVGVRRWREWRKERETWRRRKKRFGDLFSLGEGVFVLHVRSKLGWQGFDKFCACVCFWVCVCGCVCVCVWSRQSEGF